MCHVIYGCPPREIAEQSVSQLQQDIEDTENTVELLRKDAGDLVSEVSEGLDVCRQIQLASFHKTCLLNSAREENEGICQKLHTAEAQIRQLTYEIEELKSYKSLVPTATSSTANPDSNTVVEVATHQADDPVQRAYNDLLVTAQKDLAAERTLREKFAREVESRENELLALRIKHENLVKRITENNLCKSTAIELENSEKIEEIEMVDKDCCVTGKESLEAQLRARISELEEELQYCACSKISAE